MPDEYRIVHRVGWNPEPPGLMAQLGKLLADLLALFRRKPEAAPERVPYEPIPTPSIEIRIPEPPPIVVAPSPGPDPEHATMLSKHFSLAEFLASQTATRLGIDNSPTPEILEELKHTAHGAELIRDLLGGRAMLLSSGYRCPALNDAVVGSDSSDHCKGRAIDFTCPSFGTPQEVAWAIANSPLMGADGIIDQVIDEFGRWVHVGFGPRRRRMALTMRRHGRQTVTTPGIKQPPARGGPAPKGLVQGLIGERRL